MTATVGRQIRMELAEYEALMKAAPVRGANAYIVNALRRELIRDGHLAKPTKTKQPRARRRAAR